MRSRYFMGSSFWGMVASETNGGRPKGHSVRIAGV
jgi:hypothetical protein